MNDSEGAAIGSKDSSMSRAMDSSRSRLPQGGMSASVDLAQIIECHQQELYLFLLHTVAHAEDARDLLQDTFSDAWRATKQSSPPFRSGHAPSEIRRWLFHVAYCHAISSRRRNRRMRWESLQQLESMGATDVAAAAPATTFEEQVVEHDAVRAALTHLVPEDAATLMLIVGYNFTANEAAAILGLSPQAVAKRLSRAKRRLLAVYLQQNVLPEENDPR